MIGLVTLGTSRATSWCLLPVQLAPDANPEALTAAQMTQVVLQVSDYIAMATVREVEVIAQPGSRVLTVAGGHAGQVVLTEADGWMAAVRRHGTVHLLRHDVVVGKALQWTLCGRSIRSGDVISYQVARGEHEALLCPDCGLAASGAAS